MPSPRTLTPDDLARPHPVLVVWELTLRCDQACRHCGSRAGAARRDELSREEALAVVDQLGGLGVREVALIGGEAYLRSDWLELVAAISAAGMRCTVVSGGRGMTPERARALAAAGAFSVSISVDGLGPTHDTLRAVPGSLAAALHALDAVREAGMVATVNTQVNRRNRHELEELAPILLDSGIQVWQLQLTTPMGRAAEQARLILQPWHFVDLFPRLERLSVLTWARGCALIGSNNIGYFGPHEASLRAGGHWTGCPGALYTLGLQSDGAVKACSSLPTAEYADMNVRDTPLAVIFEKSAALRQVRERTPEGLRGRCADCYYGEICMAGCVWTASTLFGHWGDNPLCHHRALELKAAGLRERLVPRSSAPGKAFDHGLWEIVLEPWSEEEGDELPPASVLPAFDGGGCG